MGNNQHFSEEESYDFLEEVVFRLEKAWQADGEADLRQFVVDSDHPLRERVLVELIKVDQEYRWEGGTRKTLEDYLREWPELELNRSLLAELLTAECETRAYLNERTTCDELRARFPDVSEQIEWKAVGREWADSGAEESETPEFRVRCPHCHRPVLVRGDESLREVACPCCQSRFSVLQDDSFAVVPESSSGTAQRVGQYDLLQKVGKGSFGTVWKARDTRLDCIVAIKIPRFGQLHGEEGERFVKEARAAAQLQHPNIAHVREVGLGDVTPYIASDFIEGTPLDEILAEQRLGPREAAQLCIKIAGALHYAHERGVVHRDLKPSNIMIDSSGEPHLMDFGLAKREAGEVTMTLDGQIIGTPAYMSPEQARGSGHEADRRCDVYSLGVLLFEMLTGEQPFRGNIRMLLKQVVEDAPPALRKLNSHIPRDLETICLKCLEKRPEKRFASAEAVADELRRFLHGVPIMSRPIGPHDRAWRWCRRKPLVAGLAAAFLLASIGGTLISSLFAVEAIEQANAASVARDRAEHQKERAERRTEEVRAAKEEAERLLYANQVALAQREWKAGHLAEAWNYMDACRWDFRGWEHDYLFTEMNKGFRELAGHTKRLRTVAFSPDGKRIASGSHDKTIKVWDVETGEELRTIRGHAAEVMSVAFGPEGRRIVSGGFDRTVRIWDAETGEELQRFEGHQAQVLGVDFDPTGERVASVSIDRTLRVWDVRSVEQVFSCSSDDSGFVGVSYSPDGKRIAGITRTKLMLFEAKDGRKVFSSEETPRPFHSVDFSPDGKRIVVGGCEGLVRVLDTETGQTLRECEGHNGTVTAVAFGPEGRQVISGGMDKSVRVWNAETGEEIRSLIGHLDMVLCVAVSPTGGHIASGSKDRLLGVWEGWGQMTPRALASRKWGVRDIAVSHDGRRTAISSQNGEVQLWDIESCKELLTFQGDSYRVNVARFTLDDRHVATGGMDHMIRIWDARSGEEVDAIEAAERIVHLAVSPDGSRLAAGCCQGKAAVWDLATKERLFSIDKKKKPGLVVAFDSKGRLVLGGPSDEPLEVWDIDRGEVVLKTKGRHAAVVMSLACSLDGRCIVSGSFDETAKVWDANTGEELHTLYGHSGGVAGVAVSPDGKRVATCSSDATIKVWNPETGRETMTLYGHRNHIMEVVFSPDGRRIISGSLDGTARIWEANSRQKTHSLVRHSTEVTTIGFSSNGNWIATGAKDDTVVLWDAHTGRYVHTLRGHTDVIRDIAFSPDNRSIASASADGTIRIWKVEDGREQFVLGEGLGPRAVLDVAFSPDGRRIAGVSIDGIVTLWDVRSRKPRCTLAVRDGKVLCAAFDPKGRRFAVGSSAGTLTVWDTKFRVAERTFAVGNAPVRSVAFGPQGKRLVAGMEDGVVLVCDPDSEKTVRTMKGHAGPVFTVAYSPDGSMIATGAADCLVRIWSAETGELIRQLRGHTGRVNRVAFSPDGHFVASASEDATGKVWAVEEGTTGNTAGEKRDWRHYVNAE